LSALGSSVSSTALTIALFVVAVQYTEVDFPHKLGSHFLPYTVDVIDINAMLTANKFGIQNRFVQLHIK